MTLTNQAVVFFSQEDGWPPEVLQKKTPCTQSIMQKYLQQRETVGEAAADEEEEEARRTTRRTTRRY